MLVETHLPEGALAEVRTSARSAEAAGLDALAVGESRHDSFILSALIAEATERVRVSTSVAIAFPRSPMVVAYTAHNLQELAKGRFALGLGTQVKGHIERRFSTPWVAPGPRLREYVLSLRAIWDCWQNGTALNFKGEHYAFTLMTPEFSPPPIPYRIPIHLAAVNTYNIQLTAELADGLRVHPFCTPEYLRDVIWPNVRIGAARGGREPDEVAIIGCGFVATGASEAAVQNQREQARRRIAFYASTRTYLPVLAHHGWEGIVPELRRLIAENRWGELGSLVSDDILDTFCMSGTYDVIARRVQERLGGLVDWLSFTYPADAAEHPEAFTQALRDMRAIPTARAR